MTKCDERLRCVQWPTSPANDSTPFEWTWRRSKADHRGPDVDDDARRSRRRTRPARIATMAGERLRTKVRMGKGVAELRLYTQGAARGRCTDAEITGELRSPRAFAAASR